MKLLRLFMVAILLTWVSLPSSCFTIEVPQSFNVVGHHHAVHDHDYAHDQAPQSSRTQHSTARVMGAVCALMCLSVVVPPVPTMNVHAVAVVIDEVQVPILTSIDSARMLKPPRVA